MTNTSAAIAAVFAVTFPAAAQSVGTLNELRTAAHQARDADLQADWARLLDVRDRVARLTTDETAAPLVHYYLGYIDWRLSSLAWMAAGPRGVIALMDSASHELSKAGDTADAHALHASVLGMLIAGDPKRAPELSPKWKAEWEAALKLGADNPRVILLNAMKTFFAPPQYGGDKERGLELWREAIAKFERAPAAGAGWPDWGHAEAWGWLGGAHLSMGDRAKARDAFQRALKLRPDFWWVERIALPQAKRPAVDEGS